MSDLIRCRRVSKIYGDGTAAVTALQDVDLEVEPGELVALLGRSGSGKSTLIHLVGGLDQPTSGEILVGDQDLASLDDAALTLYRRHTVGLVFQFFNLIPTMSVLENVVFPSVLDKRQARADSERRALELLDAVGLSDRRDTTPDRLSGGQQQRVALARAWINRPQIVLADEPTGNHDSTTEQEILELLARLAREEGTTILMATHSRDAMAVTGRVVQLQDGRLVEDSLSC
ncbi:MAG: ABC transporter ATP-binding protein [Planctomycetota bacterium]